MKSLYLILICLMLGACASKGGSTVVVAGDCSQSVYTNGSRVTCTNFDVLEFGQAFTVTEERPCGSDPSIYFLRMSNGQAVDVRSGTVQQIPLGTPITEGTCQFTL